MRLFSEGAVFVAVLLRQWYYMTWKVCTCTWKEFWLAMETLAVREGDAVTLELCIIGIILKRDSCNVMHLLAYQSPRYGPIKYWFLV